MAKEITTLPKKIHSFWHDTLSEYFRDYGFRSVTPAVLRKIYKALGLEPPDVLRTKDVKDREWKIKDINGYTISVHTTYNQVTGRFSEYGMPCIVIEDIACDKEDERRVLTRSFHRMPSGSFIHAIGKYIAFLTWELEENRPLTQKKNWAKIKEIGHDQFFWVDEEGKKIRNFFAHANRGVFSFIYKDQNKRKHYTKVVRARLGIRRRLRDIRKPYKKRKTKK